MTNILVPTDFTPASLQMANAAIKQCGKNPCNIVLFHAFDLPASPHDLIGSTRYGLCSGLLSEPFRHACHQLKKDWGKGVGSITVQCMRGNTRNLFRNFIDAHDIDLIYCPDEFVFSKVHADSLDPVYFFKKCGIPVMKASVWQKERKSSGQLVTVSANAHA